MTKKRLQVNVDFSRYPQLYKALQDLEEKLDTDKSKLIRALIREKVHKIQGVTKSAEARHDKRN